MPSEQPQTIFGLAAPISDEQIETSYIDMMGVVEWDLSVAERADRLKRERRMLLGEED